MLRKQFIKLVIFAQSNGIKNTIEANCKVHATKIFEKKQSTGHGGETDGRCNNKHEQVPVNVNGNINIIIKVPASKNDD